jgi:sugar-specific transcriptional regulator TrmB
MATPTPPKSTPFLDRIGMDADEQKVYLALLALGPLTAGEIAHYSGITNISKVKKILEGLFAKDYAYNIEGLVDKAIGLYPFREIAEEAGKDAQKIDALVKELKDYVAEQVKHFNQVMKETEDFVNKEKAAATTTITTNSTDTRKAIDQKLDETKNTISTTATATKKKVTGSVDKFLKDQTATADAFEKETNEHFDAFNADLKAQSETTLTNLAQGIKEKNDAFLSEGTTTLEGANTAIKKKTDELAITLKDHSKGQLNGIRDNLLNGLETFANESESNINSMHETIVSTSNEQFTAIKTTTEESKDNRFDRNEQFKTGMGESFDKVKSNFAEDVQAFEDKLSKKLAAITEKFKQQIDQLRADTTEQISLLCEEANTNLGEMLQKHSEEISTNVDLDNKAVEDDTAAMLAKISENNEQALETINTSTEGVKSSIVLLKANYSGDINSRVDETANTMSESIDTTATATKEDYDGVTNDLTAKVTTLTQNNSKDAKTIADKHISEIATMSDTLVTEEKKQLATTKTTMINETKKTQKKIASDMNTSVDSMSSTASTASEELATQSKTSIKDNEETSIGAVTKITNVVEDSVRKEIESVKSSLHQYYDRFSKDSLKISSLLNEFRKQNEAFHETMTTYPRPTVETAILYGKAAVFHRLNDMLSTRIKSNVTMVIPDPTDIPTKILPEVKAQAKMTIISKIDEVANKGIIDEIKAGDALQRIKIRKIGQQDMAGYSQYIAFDRDGGEEMVIAFKDESMNDWVGILSKSDGFKNVVIGETLGRQALSISRELK